jgi:pimeloyl-ACP methyl ester carboxylesterase
MLWARSRDPFERIAFSVPTVGGRPVRGLAVLPKPAAKCPVVVFFHGSGSSLLESGKHLRQIAELGLAAVGIEYDQSSQPEFDRQCSALCEYIGQQPWALSNATAWIGLSLGAQRSLSFVLRHPETQPQLLVRLAGGWISELDGPDAGRSSNPVGLLRCPVLLVHGENDAIFPVADAKRLLNLLEATGKTGKLIILPNHEHGFGDDREAVMRAAAEFCRAQLPVTDYLAALAGCSLTPQERQRANAAMQRAGSFRRELWQTIISIREPERSRLLPMISGLDDYDLVRLSPRRLKAIGLAVRPAREN